MSLESVDSIVSGVCAWSVGMLLLAGVDPLDSETVLWVLLTVSVLVLTGGVSVVFGAGLGVLLSGTGLVLAGVDPLDSEGVLGVLLSGRVLLLTGMD